MNLKYDNIAISGGIGVGTTTLLKNLDPYLSPLGFEFKSMGQIIREHMNEFVNPVSKLVSDDYDRQIEESMKVIFQEKKGWVIEAWLAGFMARGIDKTLKVLVVCSEDAIRIDRIVNREKVSVDEAKHLIRERESINLEKWSRLYGHNDFWDPKHYDIIVDTYSAGPMETVGKVLDALGYTKAH